MRLFLLCLPLLLAACASRAVAPEVAEAPDNFRAEDFTAPSAGARITLLPLQETQYEMLRAGAEMLEAQLKKQLGALGYQVTLVKRDDYLKQWLEEGKAVGGVYVEDTGDFKPKEYAQALASLMRKTCAATACDLLINHRLLLRPALVDKGHIHWDGVRQPFLLQVQAEQGFAVSVEVAALTPQGELGFRRYGGVTALSGIALEELRQNIEKRKFFVDADIAQGARIALQPLRERLSGAMPPKPVPVQAAPATPSPAITPAAN